MSRHVGAKNPNWRGGRRRGGQGMRYWVVYVPDHPFARNGVLLEHRLVMEETLGRYLTEDEVVHHVNGDPSDNRPENLEVMSMSDHARIHYREILYPHRYIKPPAVRVDRSCQQCGDPFVAVGKKQAKQRFCTQACYWRYRAGRGRLTKGVAA